MRRSVTSKRLKKILRHNFAFHQNCPIYFTMATNGHKTLRADHMQAYYKCEK